MKPIPVGTLVRLSKAAHDSYGYYDGYHSTYTVKWLGLVTEVKKSQYRWQEDTYTVKWVNAPDRIRTTTWRPTIHRKDLKYAKISKLLKN